MMRCLILDDEPLAVRLLKDYVGKTPGLELVYAGSEVFKALDMAQNATVDLVLLDIQMPELTGIQFMKILKGKCNVILTTAYEEYALQGFEHDVIDYLLKPISFERFVVAIEKAKRRTQTSVGNAELKPLEYIFIRSEYKMLKVDLQDILFFEGLRDYVAIHTTNGKIMTLQSMRSLEEVLPALAFARVHKSYIISINSIQQIEKNRVVIGKEYIPIGDTYKENFLKQLNLLK
jgi:two-component system, LytTR family, response regulator